MQACKVRPPVHHCLGSFLLGYATIGTGMLWPFHLFAHSEYSKTKRWLDAYVVVFHDITMYMQALGRCYRRDDDQKMIQHHLEVRAQGSRIS